MNNMEVEQEIVGDTRDFEEEIKQLESEHKRMQDEFNTQRAKLKELYLQREDEIVKQKLENQELLLEKDKLKKALDEAQSQVLLAGMEMESNVANEKRKADEQIASLQQLVNDTVEESSCVSSNYSLEVQKLQSYVKQLLNENQELKHQQHSPHHSQENSLAPSAVLSVVTKKIARKLGADAFTSQEEDHRDEADLMLVDSLEEEIKALKDKLRATDEQLQKCIKCSHTFEQEMHIQNNADDSIGKQTTSTNTSFDVKQSCDMCSNYEAELVKEQGKVTELELKLLYAEKAVDRHKEDLVKEIGFRKDMEEKWNVRKEEHRLQVAALNEKVIDYEKDVQDLRQCFGAACDEMKKTLNLLTRDRENVQKELERLQNQNDNLVGKFVKHSQDLQNEIINLPDTVEELQELLLQTKEDLITGILGKEESEEEVKNLHSEIVLLKEMVEDLQKQHQLFERDRRMLDKLKNKEKEAEMKLIELQNELKFQKEATKQLEKKNAEMKSKNASLLHTLDTNETVQKDFVLLSQDLQVQLQKIRDADTQVRWQHDEDVDDCPICKLAFTAHKRKEHCRHCGQIFCANCLQHVVPSGPHQRPSRVCDVCHTLLVKTSPPYFSNEAPHSPA